MNTLRIELYEAESKKFRFKILDSDGSTLGTSQPFNRIKNAIQRMSQFLKYSNEISFFDLTREDKKEIEIKTILYL